MSNDHGKEDEDGVKNGLDKCVDAAEGSPSRVASSSSCQGANCGEETPAKPFEGPDAYPLHWLVWHNDYRRLEEELSKGKVIEI